MLGRCVLAAAAVAMVAVFPAASAQEAVDGCTRQCDPLDPDVNDPPHRTEGPVNVVLYGHFDWGAVSPFAPMNLQHPLPEMGDANWGYTIPSLDTPVDGPVGAWTHARMSFCPGTVAVVGEEFHHRCHPGRAGPPIRLADDTITLYWYMSADSSPSQEVPLGAFAAIGVRATLYEGWWNWYPDRRLGHGESEGTAHVVSAAGLAPDVVEFRVPIRMEVSSLPSFDGHHPPEALGFHVHIQFYQLEHESGVTFTQPGWRVRTGPEFAPRLILPVENPLEPGGFEIHRSATGLAVRAITFTPLGAYDLDTGSVALEVFADGERLEAPVEFARFAAGRYGQEDYEAHADWRVDLTGLDRAVALRLVASATNLQGTRSLVQETSHEWQPFGGESIPGPAPVILLMALGAAAAHAAHARRRP